MRIRLLASLLLIAICARAQQPATPRRFAAIAAHADGYHALSHWVDLRLER